MRRLLLLLAAMTLAVPALAADTIGIPVGRKFVIPFQVNGKNVVARAYVGADKVLTVWYVHSGDLDSVEYTVTRKDVEPDPQPDPEPQPDPQPDPKPDPKPVPTKLWAVVIAETKDRTPAQAAVLASTKFRALFDGGYRDFDPLDKDGKERAVPVDLKVYAERAKTMTKPVLFIVDDSGNVYYDGALPATVAKAETLVAEIRGGGK